MNRVAKGSRVEKRCAECGKLFIKENNRQKYCSSACRNKRLKSIILKREYVCPVCQKCFHPHRIQQQYCSYKCSGKVKQEKIEKICTHCGMAYQIKPSRAKHRRFCSEKCYAAYKQINSIGKSNANWRGGRSKLRHIGRHGKGNRLYRKGRYFENLTRKEIEREGFYTIRSAASKGIWDIIGIRSDKIRLIQVKTNRLPRPSERKIMEHFLCPENSTKESWIFYGRGKKELWIWHDRRGWEKKIIPNEEETDETI